MNDAVIASLMRALINLHGIWRQFRVGPPLYSSGDFNSRTLREQLALKIEVRYSFSIIICATTRFPTCIHSVVDGVIIVSH